MRYQHTYITFKYVEGTLTWKEIYPTWQRGHSMLHLPLSPEKKCRMSVVLQSLPPWLHQEQHHTKSDHHQTTTNRLHRHNDGQPPKITSSRTPRHLDWQPWLQAQGSSGHGGCKLELEQPLQPRLVSNDMLFFAVIPFGGHGNCELWACRGVGYFIKICENIWFQELS